MIVVVAAAVVVTVTVLQMIKVAASSIIIVYNNYILIYLCTFVHDGILHMLYILVISSTIEINCILKHSTTVYVVFKFQMSLVPWLTVPYTYCMTILLDVLHCMIQFFDGYVTKLSGAIKSFRVGSISADCW